MRTPFEQQALESIRREAVIRPGARVGVAVSGGADSVALLRILEALANELGITLLVAHFNHSLRASESDADATFVEDLAKEFGLRFLQRTENVPRSRSAKGGISKMRAANCAGGFSKKLRMTARPTRLRWRTPLTIRPKLCSLT